MRLLIVVHSPLTATLGAAQMALNLADAMRAQGIDALAWSPYPRQEKVPWWCELSWVRRRVRQYVEENGPFDVIDSPPIMLSWRLARHATVVARSVGPDLLYLWTSWRARRARHKFAITWFVEAAFDLYLAVLVLNGWLIADRIFCVGSLERDWMHRWFPWWRKKTTYYVNAIDDGERAALAEVRRARRQRDSAATRYLWLGRWTEHKGISTLIEFIRQNAAQRSPARITIAGCGDQPKQDIGAELIGAACVSIVPKYDRRELARLLQDHDAGLFTSVVEGWGLSVQEMLESGMPVYATEAGAVADLRSEFPSLLKPFPPLQGGDPAIPDSRELDSSYLARFSWDSIVRAYLTSGKWTSPRAPTRAGE
ncbi:MAG: glycosyltransferase family 4 protein [Betaproteobacteria bacterium]